MQAVTTQSTVVKKTQNASLQQCLDVWVAALQQVQQSAQLDLRKSMIERFVRTFVPLDVEEEDICHYANSLIYDEVYFL